MNKCEWCRRKKGVVLKCSSCESMYCPGCIQLEEHKCKNIHKKIESELLVLEKRNVKIESKKV
jgi:hypothetical protein